MQAISVMAHAIHNNLVHGSFSIIENKNLYSEINQDFENSLRRGTKTALH